MNGIDRNLLSITSSSLKLLKQAQYKVQAASEQLSSAQPSLENFQTSPTSTDQQQTLNTELEISRIRTPDLAESATEQIISKIFHAVGSALLSQAENLSQTVSRLLD